MSTFMRKLTSFTARESLSELAMAPTTLLVISGYRSEKSQPSDSEEFSREFCKELKGSEKGRPAASSRSVQCRIRSGEAPHRTHGIRVLMMQYSTALRSIALGFAALLMLQHSGLDQFRMSQSQPGLLNCFVVLCKISPSPKKSNSKSPTLIVKL